MTNWEKLIERFLPEGQRVCNCRKAYETLLPPELSGATRCVNGEWTRVEAWVCRYGCQSAQVTARDIVAKEIIKLLPEEFP